MPATFATKLCLGLASVASAGAVAVEEASIDEGTNGECSLMQLKSKPSSSNPFAKGLLAALQSSREESANGEARWGCIGVEVQPLKPAQSEPLLTKRHLDKDSFAWWNMPVQQPFQNLQKQGEGLEEVPWSFYTPRSRRWPLMKKGKPADIISKMYDATKVDGVFEKMPEKMQGVFWMKGNGVPEELTVLHYGGYWAEENLMVQVQAPFTWAWPAGRPHNAPYFGVLYSNDESAGMSWAGGFTQLAPTMTYKFSDRCLGDYCKASNQRRGSSMTYAYMQTHIHGYVSEAMDLGKMAANTLGLGSLGVLQGAFTLQEMPDSVNGSHWKRTCHWGLGVANCAFAEFGSYDLVKIVGPDGQPLQPQYNEFIEYMGDVPLFVWAGWRSEEEKSRVARAQRHSPAVNTINVSLPSLM